MRFITSFISFSIAILLAIVIFAPDRIPPGYGYEPVPVELEVVSSITGQIVESVTGKSGKNIVVKNMAEKPIYNVRITLLNGENQIKHQFVKSTLPASEKITLGWAQKWEILSGDQLEIIASMYYKSTWAL